MVRINREHIVALEPMDKGLVGTLLLRCAAGTSISTRYFPQAFSHIALVNTAHNLTHLEKPSEHRGNKKALPSKGEVARGCD